jgi:hypothetical protein
VQREGYSTSPTNVSTVTLVSGATTNAILSLIPDGIVRGRVLNSSGQFVPNAWVQALSIVYVNGVPALSPAITRTTDDRGEYRLFGVPPGEYYIAAVPPAPATVSTPVTGSTRSVATFYRSSPTFADAAMIKVISGQEIAGIDVVLQTNLQVVVSGRVLVNTVPPPNGGQPAPAEASNAPTNTANLMLLPRNRNPLEPPNLGVSASVSFKGAVGEFEIQNVIPGQYDLFGLVQTPQGFVRGRTPITVIDRDLTGVFVVTQPGLDLRGTVTLDGRPPSRLPEISLQSTDGVPFSMKARPQEDMPGAFNLPGVPDGRFRLNVTVPVDVYLEDILQGSRSVYDLGLDVRAGPLQDPLQIILKSGAAGMEGVVYDASGKPLAGASVALVPLERRGNPALYRSAISNPTGAFAFTGITPGEYKLFGWIGNVNGAFFDFGFMANYENNGQRIVVSPGSKSTVQVTAVERK